MSPEEQWQHMWELQQLPRTPGTAGGLKSPMTPRTRAFNALDGSQQHTSGMVIPPLPLPQAFQGKTAGDYYAQQEEIQRGYGQGQVQQVQGQGLYPGYGR